jgi:hypothetical protein
VLIRPAMKNTTVKPVFVESEVQRQPGPGRFKSDPLTSNKTPSPDNTSTSSPIVFASLDEPTQRKATHSRDEILGLIVEKDACTCSDERSDDARQSVKSPKGCTWRIRRR